jgi:hypothetical protein
MRIMNHISSDSDGERMVFRARFAKSLAVPLTLLGGAVLVSAHHWPGHVASVLFLLFPALFLVCTGALLYCYESRAEVDTVRRMVTVSERVAVPLRTLTWELDEFSSVRPRARVSGSADKASTSSYYTVTLCGPRTEVPLFDVDDYAEATRAARALASRLGLPGNHKQSP